MKFRLIIVEDEPLEKKALRHIISQNFSNIDIVAEPSDGLTALQEIKRWHPDLLFLDIGIPEIDGLAVQEQAIQMFPSVQTTVLTAYSDFDHAHQALTNQVVDYLVKPARSSQIIASVNKLLSTLPKSVHNTQKNEISNEIIQKAISYIEQNYFRELQQKELAKLLYIHPQYLSRLFKKEMGMSFGTYLNNFRIEKSKELLLHTNMPIYVIATECGFSDAAYFCKKFHQITATTPLQYRKNKNF